MGSSYPNGFRKGINIRNVPILNTYGGDIYWVDSDSGGNKGSFAFPFQTLQAGVDACTASNGDIVLIKPGHAETLTAQIDADTAGVKIIGLGDGNLRPTLTGNGTIDVIDVSAANVTIENIIFAVPSTDAQTADINIDAAGCTVRNTLHHGSTTAKNKVDIITLTANADDALLDGVRIYNDTVEVVGGIVFEGACSRVEVANCMVQDSVGFTGGSISDEATALQLYIHDSVFSNAKADTVVMEFGNNSTGVCSFCHINGRHTTLASNVTTGTGMAFFENRVVEEAALNGAIIPTADAE
jgi:hypothetical protein